MNKLIVIAISIVVVFVAILLVLANSGVRQTQSANRSIILCIAGAYAAEGSYLAKAFGNSTGAQVLVKPGGSFALAQQIALGYPCNVFMPVAFRQAVSMMGAYDPGWAIAVAADSNVIVYSNASLSAFPDMGKVIEEYRKAHYSNSSDAWYSFFNDLTSGKYKLGVANPSTDPEGLYAMLILQAAGVLYAHNATYFIARMIANGANVTRTSTFYYVVPLKEGQMSFVFSYKSYAVSNGLQYLELPPWLNFGDSGYTGWYSRFSYTISVGGKGLEIKGSPVYLYVTIPKGSNNKLALDFVLFILENRSALARYGLTPLERPIVFGNTTALPEKLRDLLNNGSLIYGGQLT
ncbi:substrate-binding domain-containing protein [Thermoproteus tenax]|uniref:ABC-type sulfate transport system, substrate-binding protein n=1 Tax=Thermoproteus tenax (strain ATCC 35583 / DSM 2078 / JCM 9277 / NBRC 100435 / Kra 1) TaxID=768679 RepID=G4RPR1_THETK|nr:substrate-binding domain-containing protein [Thermoproteus tenax]CCC81556.1 ABC-type sulfate transport system, substrate-binding protein [Thermoproteus tenax Kra 1]